MTIGDWVSCLKFTRFCPKIWTCDPTIVVVHRRHHSATTRSRTTHTRWIVAYYLIQISEKFKSFFVIFDSSIKCPRRALTLVTRVYKNDATFIVAKSNSASLFSFMAREKSLSKTLLDYGNSKLNCSCCHCCHLPAVMKTEIAFPLRHS